MGTEIGKRLRWIQLFEELKNCTQVCLKCGISRPTLRKWLGRYQERGLDGLTSESRRPARSPTSRVSDRERQWIAALRARGLGSRRIQSELKRSHDFDISRPTIEKVLKMCAPRPRLVRPVTRKGSKRYAKEIPGERIQMDTCRSGRGCISTRRLTIVRESVCSHYSIGARQQTRFSLSNSPSKSFRFPFSASKRIVAGNSSPIPFRKS